MPKGHLEGDAGVITTQGKPGPMSLKEYNQFPGPADGPRAEEFTFYNGNANGGAIVYVGPNKKAAFPIFPPAVAGGQGTAITFKNVDPAKMSIDDKGSASTVYFTYGGECRQDARE